MEYAEVLRRRHMVRNYTDRPVGADQLARIASAGTAVPSAGFAQGYRLVLVTDASTIGELAEAADEAAWVERGYEPWLSRAPAMIVLCVDPTAYRARYSQPDKAESTVRDPRTGEWTIPWWWVDGGASLLAILLACVDEGLDAGFLGGHAVPGARRVLGIPDEVELVGIITVGHGAPDRRSTSLDRGRVPDATLIRHDRWDS